MFSSTTFSSISRRSWFLLGLLTISLGCDDLQDNETSTKASASRDAEKTNATSPMHDHGSSDAHADHSAAKTAATQRRLEVSSQPAPPEAGSSAKLMLQILDADDTQIREFDVIHEKLVHLIMVREGLDEFAHLHPEVDSSGTLTTDFAFPRPGIYRLFADHQPHGKAQGVAVGNIIVSGDDKPAESEALVANSSPDVAVGDMRVHVTLHAKNDETTVRFQFAEADGTPVTDLQPYLGAMGHLVVISADGSDYVHAHPLSEARTAPEGIVEFATHFPKPGLYKMWGQFERNHIGYTVPYVVEHGSGTTAEKAL
jgi:hypothetical protein